MTKKLSTNDIFAKIEKGEPVDVKEVEFVSPDTMRDKLYAKITEIPSSINHFADLCGIYPSHLHEFLKGTKNLGRDKLLRDWYSYLRNAVLGIILGNRVLNLCRVDALHIAILKKYRKRGRN